MNGSIAISCETDPVMKLNWLTPLQRSFSKVGGGLHVKLQNILKFNALANLTVLALSDKSL